MSARTRRAKTTRRVKIDVTRTRLLRLDFTAVDALLLQDAIDDYARDAGAGATGATADRIWALQCTLHALTGEELPTRRREQASIVRVFRRRDAGEKGGR